MERAVLRRVAVAMAVSGTLLATACSGSTAGVTTARPTIATAVESTTTTDPYAVPPVIDVAYVNRVLAGLDAAVGDVVRFVVQTHPAAHDITLRLRPLYNDKAAALQLEGFYQDFKRQYLGYRNVPGNQISAVTELTTVSPTCIFAHVSRDYGPVVSKPNPDLADQWMALVPKDFSRDPDRSNPTGWMYIYDGFEEDHSRPANPCDA